MRRDYRRAPILAIVPFFGGYRALDYIQRMGSAIPFRAIVNPCAQLIGECLMDDILSNDDNVILALHLWPLSLVISSSGQPGAAPFLTIGRRG